MVNFNIKLLPHGTLIRDLVLTALSPLALASTREDASIEIYEDEALVNGHPHHLIQVFQNAQRLLQAKASLHRIRLHHNDRDIVAPRIEERINVQLEGDSYQDYIRSLIEWAMNDIQRNPNQWRDSLGNISYSADSIILGDEENSFSCFQPIKIEKYEYGKRFGNLETKFDIRVDVRWLALIMAGFGVSYSHFTFDNPQSQEGEIVLSVIPEKVLAKATIDLRWVNYVSKLSQSMGCSTAFEGLLILPFSVKVSPELPHAYSLLLAIELHEVKPRDFEIHGAPPYIFYRIADRKVNTKRTFTLLERLSIDVSFLAPFVEKLHNTKDVLKDFLRCTITQARRQSNYCSKRFGDAALCDRLSRALYAAAAKVKPADETIYMLARSSPENSPFRRTDVLREIYNALS